MLAASSEARKTAAAEIGHDERGLSSRAADACDDVGIAALRA